MVLIILSCIYFFFYCPWAWFTYSRILNSYDHNKHYKPDLPEKYKPFMRYDIINWSKAEIWFGAFILIPIRAPVVLLSMFTFNLVLLIASKGILHSPCRWSRGQAMDQMVPNLAASALYDCKKLCVHVRIAHNQTYNKTVRYVVTLGIQNSSQITNKAKRIE